MSDHVTDALKYASDERWLELGQGRTEFTSIDRWMLLELHTRARIALAYLDGARTPDLATQLPRSAEKSEK